MSLWKCSACGYIHQGDDPPETCPVCKAKKKKFAKASENSTRRWRCSVCNYIHEGDQPPEECPICKASADKFVEIDSEGNELPKSETDETDETGETGETAPAEEAAAPAPPPPVEEKKPSILIRMVMRFHIHPIAVHIPNGLLPAAVIFLAIAVFFQLQNLELAAFYNFLFVLLAMPVVLTTGYLEWKHRYKGAKTFRFFAKIACSAVVTLCLIALVGWRFLVPTVAGADSPYRLIYLGIALIMLLAAAIAGNIGGKLVFGARDHKKK